MKSEAHSHVSALPLALLRDHPHADPPSAALTSYGLNGLTHFGFLSDFAGRPAFASVQPRLPLRTKDGDYHRCNSTR